MEALDPVEIPPVESLEVQQARIVREGIELARHRLRITPGQLAAQGFMGRQIEQKLRGLYGPSMKPPETLPTEL